MTAGVNGEFGESRSGAEARDNSPLPSFFAFRHSHVNPCIKKTSFFLPTHVIFLYFQGNGIPQEKGSPPVFFDIFRILHFAISTSERLISFPVHDVNPMLSLSASAR